MIVDYVREIRPRQWTKNLALFAGVIFARKFFEAESAIKAVLAFIDFCLVSSAIYLINDIKDIESDRLHPIKKDRPIAAGRISVGAAWTAAVIFAIAALTLGYLLNYQFFIFVTLYFFVMVAYSFFLKHIVIVDIMVIAGGFVCRAVAGAKVVEVSISSWLLVCTIFIALFLIISKRRHEVILLGDDAKGHRKILEEYGGKFLDQLIAIVTAATLMSYMLYTVDPITEEKFHTHNLILTSPLVIFGVFRYLYLVYQKNKGGRPEQLLLTDLPLLAAIILWALMVVVIIY